MVLILHPHPETNKPANSNNMKTTGPIYILPYVAWMILMLALPATAGMYAIRASVCAICLYGGFLIFMRTGGRIKLPLSALAIGIFAGIAVWAIWVLPENFEIYRKWMTYGIETSSAPSPYSPEVCGWTLTILRLFGSAFVVAAAEELFFRRWLYQWLGADRMAFVWMVVLFALEHNRPAVAALAGAIYGWLALRRGLGAAIIAHMTTNFILGAQVIITKDWAFW